MAIIQERPLLARVRYFGIDPADIKGSLIYCETDSDRPALYFKCFDFSHSLTASCALAVLGITFVMMMMREHFSKFC